MKFILYTMLIAAATLITSCSADSGKEELGGGSDELGQVELIAETSGEVEAQTRATVTLPASVVPTADRFSLHITGTYNDDMGKPQPFDQNWTSFSKFDSPKMRRGEYTASVSYGDMNAEGVNAACFSGTQNFTILARKTISASVTASLKNSAFKVVFNEWFNKYYKDAQITIRTESKNNFTFDSKSAGIIFVKPGTKLYLKGTATKSQTDTEVEFPEVEIGTSAARTLHTITIKASEAGSGNIVIILNDAFTEVEEEVVELNPEA